MTTGLALPAITMTAGSYTTNRDTIFYARVEAVGLIFADAREINALAWKSVG
jgi:hypothetical protein